MIDSRVPSRFFVSLAAAWLMFSLSGIPAGAVVVTGSWKTQVESCTMVLEEEDRSAYHLRVLQIQSKIKTPCIPTAQAFTDGFKRVMRDAAPFQKQGKEAVRIFLGRLVELPEMSRELSSTARQAREWNLFTGKPVRGHANVFVARLLLKSDTLRELLGGLKPVYLSVEKVLVPSRDMVTRWKRGASYPSKRVPYDCLLWVDVAAAQ
ncbi:MAG TPA: hypothetical protein VGA17_04955 [Nitrospiraceae bacterium]